MSYRDLRNFSESMRVLGYPQPISLESFREPNFPLVVDVIRWLATRLDPDATLGGGSNTLDQRVALVRDAAGFFLSRGNVKLNGRRVYGADGWAVREMAKVATLLRGGGAAGEEGGGAGDGGGGGDAAGGGELSLAAYDVASRLSEIRQARQLATEITARGAFLYDLLAKEPEYKAALSRALSRPLELDSTEACVRRALTAAAERAAATRERLEHAAAGDSALVARAERKRAELMRAEKRLRTVQAIKPAYQGELTALESELETLWERYVLRYRCVEALKHQLSVLENTQAEAAEEQQAAIMQLIHKYEAEDVLGKLSDSDEDSSTSEGVEDTRDLTRPTTRLRIKTAGGAGAGVGAESRRAFGNMAAAARDSLDDELDLSDDDLDDQDLYSHEVEAVSARWSRAGARSRAPRPAHSSRPARPATRTRPREDDTATGVEGSGLESLGSSDESELRLASAAPARASAAALSDNEF